MFYRNQPFISKLSYFGTMSYLLFISRLTNQTTQFYRFIELLYFKAKIYVTELTA